MTINLANKKQYVFFVENPVPGDDLPRHLVPRLFVVEEIRAIKFGGSGTFDWELRFSPNANDQGVGALLHSDSGVSDETTGIIYSPPYITDPPEIPAASWLWLELPIVSTGLARPVAVQVTVVGVEKGA